MGITTTWINRRLELFDGDLGDEQYRDVEALGRIYNRTLGPATSVNLHRPELFDLGMYSSFGKHSPVGRLMRDLTIKAGITETMIIPGGGKGATMRQPFLGALGELAERLLAVLHFAEIGRQLVAASYDELVERGYHALSPDELPLFAVEQYQRPSFPYVPFQHDTQLRWLAGRELFSGEPVLVPAQLVFIYYKHLPGEAHIGYPTTGGLAFHRDRNRAILHGLYEYIERDAINVRWYCRLAPPRVDIDLESFLAETTGIKQPRTKTAAIDEAAVFLNTLDIPIPIFTAIAIDRSKSERAFLGGGGAWGNRNRALSQALFELGQSRTALKFYQAIGLKDIQPNSTAAEMTDFFDAAIFMGYQENLSRLDWYTAGSDRIAWKDTPNSVFGDEHVEYAQMIELLRSFGMNPIVFDLNGGCWPGVWVTKVFIPELTQACIPSHPYLGHPRFFELPRSLGFSPERRSFCDLNQDPVPFP